MLNTLDTLMAFVVIIAVVSLIAALLVRMYSTFLSLRGKNLANALALMLQTISPATAKEAHGLAEYILKDPILNDS